MNGAEEGDMYPDDRYFMDDAKRKYQREIVISRKRAQVSALKEDDISSL